MNTPIYDFVKRYAASCAGRLHMPGHKGQGPLGVEALDITEVDGADSLYEASGIIAESESNASALFGCPTFYSTEGSSLAIRAMLFLSGAKKVLAGRNAHKTFLSAAALLDLDVAWLYPLPGDSYHACSVTTERLEQRILEEQPDAVYLTSPDYLGHMADVKSLAEVCHRHHVLLLVDNAHGAYLRFLAESLHPMDLGADMCCDSAHKTLPVLTGGAYLHVRPQWAGKAKQALALFGSTSPSYLILQSLDLANRYLESYKDRLAAYLPEVEALRQALSEQGFSLVEEEPLKITIAAKAYGYTGDALADLLKQQGIFVEFYDPDFLVMMFTPENGSLEQVRTALCSIQKKEPIRGHIIPPYPPARAMSVREAVLSPSERLAAPMCIGRVLAQTTVGCPPAVPIIMSGEIVDENALRFFDYYGIRELEVVIDKG